MRDRIDIESTSDRDVDLHTRSKLSLEVQLDIRDLLSDISGRLAEISARDENSYFRENDNLSAILTALHNLNR